MIFTGTLLLVLLAGFTAGSSDLFLKITRNLEIFGKVYRLVLVNYVDEIDPDSFTTEGIGAMLETLDPYTVFLNSTVSEMDLLMSGNAGGIGISVYKKGTEIAVSELIEGYSAHREGVREGDVILQVDSADVTSLSDLSSKIRGVPGTTLLLTVRRESTDEIIGFRLTREKIENQSVLFSEVLGGKTGYIRLYRFNKNAGDDVKKAVQKLLDQKISGLILDLRGNPGGRLDEAISVAKKFLPYKSLIVTTRGRNEDSKQSYSSDEVPVYSGPMAVLIDSLSASAAEVVAGALQDHDRALLVGTKSYGKGLVQTVMPVAYETSVKITTARYYTPSGRCIQIRPINRLADHPDTLKPREFKTDKGKVVLEANGISPDIRIESPEEPEILTELRRENAFSDFAAVWVKANEDKVTPGFSSGKQAFDDFLDWLRQKSVADKTRLGSYLTEIQESFKDQAAYSGFILKLDEAKKQLAADVFKDLNGQEAVIRQILKKEILLRKLSSAQVLALSYTEDPVLLGAITALEKGR